MEKSLSIIFLFLTITLQSQGLFKLKSNANQVDIVINGVDYKIDSVGIKIPTKYPKFDTLIFKTESGNSDKLIWCNFKPETTYVISGACCGNYDIIEESKIQSVKNYNFEMDFEKKKDSEKIQNKIRDKPFISIRTKEKNISEIYAWHADLSCNTEYKVIKKDLWKLGIPPKCFYWNNITSIVFFKENKKSKTQQERVIAEFLDFKNIKILSTFTFRLFNNKRYIIIFDEKEKKVTIKYEK